MTALIGVAGGRNVMDVRQKNTMATEILVNIGGDASAVGEMSHFHGVVFFFLNRFFLACVTLTGFFRG